LGLLQGWLDIGAMVILSLLCFIWAGQTPLSFCLLTCTFIPLISSGSGRTQQLFQPCSKPCPLAVIPQHHLVSIHVGQNYGLSFFLGLSAALGGQGINLLIFC
jgi:hypothetical protein